MADNDTTRNTPKKETDNEPKRKSILPGADPGTKHGHGVPIAGRLPKGQEGEADLEAGASNTDD